MKTFQFTCATRVVETGELVVIEGLLSPQKTAETPNEAMSLMHEWFITNFCVPYRQVT